MAILLTALSVHPTTAETLATTTGTSTTQNQLDSVTFGKGTSYFIDSTQQEVSIESKQDSTSLSLDDNPFYFTNTLSNTTFFHLAENRKKVASTNVSVHKYYTKKILFPFHSFW